jgi:hypothetical protein
VVLADEVKDRAMRERLVYATLMAGNRLKKGTDLPDPDEAVKQFDHSLEASLSIEKQRKAALRLVRSI